MLDSRKAVPGEATVGSAVASGAYRNHHSAIVFLIGGGNYTEWASLASWAARAQPKKTIVYGADELVSPDEMVHALETLGKIV